ncbi:MAG TPA: hypothetical protein VJI46_00595 [Candidatus Nanoarchaeia archaeon]|nr:hypothetical protein [Candidatus Nanoarchaeia archaeon]
MDIKPEQYFYLKDGKSIKSLEELYSASLAMGNEVFSHHVTSSRNDFHNWVKDVHGNGALAQLVAEAKTPKEMAVRIKGHLDSKKTISKKPAAKKSNSKKARTVVIPIEVLQNTETKKEEECKHKICMLCGMKNFLIGISVGILAGLLLSLLL